MTSFVHVEQPTNHPGVDRAEQVVQQVRALRNRFDGARGLSALLLAAIVSSMLVVADKLMSSWKEGGLLFAWLVLWIVAFAALALFAGTARSLAARTLVALKVSASRRAAARADEQFIAYARLDPRIMRELQAAAVRQEGAESASVHAANEPSPVPTLYDALRRVNLGKYY